MSSARFLVGDVRERLAELGDGTVDLVVTSPPFLALRSYLPADHPDKGKEIGSESTPAEFLTTLLELTAEWGRVLAPYGSLAVELGDTYAGSGGAGGDYSDGGLRQGQNGFTGSARRDRVEQPRQWSGGSGWPMEKSLCFIPELYGACLAYGRNLLTGEPSPAGQWRIRNLVAWVRPNPPVGALADKFRPATSYITVATRARDRWFDLDAVRVPHMFPDQSRTRDPRMRTEQQPGDAPEMVDAKDGNHPGGRPPYDWWEITPGGYSGAHYAVWPPELCKRLIESMCPRRVCVTCGQPSRRIVEKSQRYRELRERVGDFNTYKGENDRSTGNNGNSRAGQMGSMTAAEYVTVGWSDCGHDTWRPGHVLDPFGGSGTTGAVATGCGRDATLIDLDARNAELARERIGMFLTVDEATVRQGTD